eukprot:scaffold22003_cov51-Phaeocystis_antarctica.AAC.3
MSRWRCDAPFTPSSRSPAKLEADPDVASKLSSLSFALDARPRESRHTRASSHKGSPGFVKGNSTRLLGLAAAGTHSRTHNTKHALSALHHARFRAPPRIVLFDGVLNGHDLVDEPCAEPRWPSLLLHGPVEEAHRRLADSPADRVLAIDDRLDRLHVHQQLAEGAARGRSRYRRDGAAIEREALAVYEAVEDRRAPRPREEAERITAVKASYHVAAQRPIEPLARVGARLVVLLERAHAELDGLLCRRIVPSLGLLCRRLLQALAVDRAVEDRWSLRRLLQILGLKPAGELC